MPAVLHESDEETAPTVYQAYLRAQSDPELLDIVRHLDPERYPARLDAAQREARRRRVLQTPVYSQAEYLIRRTGVFALILASLLLGLTALLTPDDVRGPSWPTPEMVPDGILVSEALRLFGSAILRAIIVVSVWLGLPLATAGALGGWLISQARLVWKRQARADVWQWALVTFLILVSSMAVVAGPFSSIPDLFDSHRAFWARVHTLWCPWF